MANNLMEFRTMYLRGIAKTWGNEAEYKALLCHEGRKGIFKALETWFGYKNPWTHVKIKILDPSVTSWNPKETASWTGPNNYYIINLPKKPEGMDDLSVPLAEYYELFPTLFGCEKKKDEDKEQQPEPAVGGSLPLDLGVEDNKFFEFGGLTLRAIALAWRNPEFKEELKAASSITGAEEATEYKDATEVLSKWLGYNNPWNFYISFKENDHFEWDPNEADGNGAWVNVPRNQIWLHYPNPPGEEDLDLRAIALTSYNNTGPEYPFTCC